MSLGAGHADLNVLISEVKDMRTTAKAFMNAQSSGENIYMIYHYVRECKMFVPKLMYVYVQEYIYIYLIAETYICQTSHGVHSNCFLILFL